MHKACWVGVAAILGAWLIGTTSVSASEDEREGKRVKLPKAIAKSLKAKFPEAKIRGVSKEKNEEGETIYEVELTVPTKVDVNFDAEGDIEVIERQIGLFELPKAVRKVVAKAFPKGKIVGIETLLEEEGELKYEVVIEQKGKKPVELVVSGAGKILRGAGNSMKGDEKDEDEDDDRPKARAGKGGRDGKHEAKDRDEDDDDKPRAEKREKEEKEDEDEDDDKPKAKEGKGKHGEKHEAREHDEDDDKPQGRKGGKDEKEDEQR
jgi:hypothetical protein